MNVRIISGRFGKRLIDAPRGTITHPMSERVRSSLFNIIASGISGATVLDAFAGTGAIGLEALSRGASHVTFVERDVQAAYILGRNIELFDIASEARLVQSPVAAWVESCSAQFDVIFADPPYDDMQLSTVTGLFGLLKPNGLMVLSYPGRGEAPTGTNGVVVVDNRSYGTAALAFYRKEDA